MVGPSPPANRRERQEWWRRQLSRQQSTHLSVTEFCRQLGVSLTTFYYWKKRASEAVPNASERNSAQHPSRRLSEPAGAAAPNFVPISIVDPGADTRLEIELANACVIRLKGAIDPTLLQAAIAAAGQLGGFDQGAN
jgi:hypothetical protein